jgi:hypothetical protein
MDLLVLVEQNVTDEFLPAVVGLGDAWTAPSGRVYHLRLEGRRLEISLRNGDLHAPPPQDLVDADLFALASLIYDTVGGEWSSDALQQTAAVWGWAPA